MKKHTRSKSPRQELSDRPGILSVYSGQECAGFLLSRGKSAVEAFNAANKSLGIFRTQQAAANAIFARRLAS